MGADVQGHPDAHCPTSGATCLGMRSAAGQIRQTTTAEVRLESRPTARESRETQFIICLEDVKGLQIIHLKDRGGLLTLVTLVEWARARCASLSGRTTKRIRGISVKRSSKCLLMGSKRGASGSKCGRERRGQQ
jgi:hypothetical protein